jgi:hypothetical protein
LLLVWLVVKGGARLLASLMRGAGKGCLRLADSVQAAFARPLFRDHPELIVLVVGLVLYGWLRVGYLLFFGPLDLAPANAGISLTSTLVQPAVALILMLALVVAIVAILTLVLATLAVAVAGALLVLGVLVVTSLAETAGAGVPLRAQVIVAIVFSTITLLFALAWLIHRAHADWPALKQKLTAARDDLRPHRLPRMLAAASLVLVLFYLPVSAYVRAVEVQRVEDASRLSQLGAEVLGIYAEPATLIWSGPKPDDAPISSGACLVFLGQSDGVAAFYDPKADAPLLVAASSIVTHGRDSCR